MSKSLKTILDIISQNGSIPLDDFFRIANSEYYESNVVFGKDGDFVTSPEISQMFGEIIGISFADYLLRNALEKFSIIEIGGGTGKLMQDFLRATKHIKKFHESLQSILMIDTSHSRISEQKKSLGNYSEILKTYNSIEEVPTIKHAVFIIANELFDALPYKEFTKKSGVTYETHIKLDSNNKLEFTYVKTELNIESLNDDETVEISFESEKMANQITQLMKEKNSRAIIIDYGYVNSPKKRTLQALKNHKMTNPLENVSFSDLTYLVNFQKLKSYFDQKNFNTLITTQSEFLTNNGIQLRAEILLKNGADPIKVDSDLKRLTSKEKMGELFKVLIIEN